jgi:hypothetical protein
MNEQEMYTQLKYDSVVFSLFNSKSQQSSLRNKMFGGKLWDIKNHFFWISKDVMMKLSLEHNLEYTYTDVEKDDDRFIYNYIYGVDGLYSKLSKKAQQVIQMATQLVIDSFQYRKAFDDIESNKKYQVLNWDIGFAQVKEILKVHMKNELKEFNKIYNEFCDELRPFVYKLGFLKGELKQN